MSTALPRVAALIADYTGIDAAKINQDSDFDTLGLDSLDRVEVAMMVEDDFSVDVPENAEHSWKTVGDVTGWLETAVRS